MPPKNEGFGITDLFPAQDPAFIDEGTEEYNTRIEAAAKAGVPAKGYVELTDAERRDYEENGPVEDWELDWLLHNKSIQQAREKGEIAKKVLWEGQEHGGSHNSGRSVGGSSKGYGRLAKNYYDSKTLTKELSDSNRRIQDKAYIAQGLDDYEASLDEDPEHEYTKEQNGKVETASYETQLKQITGNYGRLLTGLPKETYQVLNELEANVAPILRYMHDHINTNDEHGNPDLNALEEQRQLRAQRHRLMDIVTTLTTTEPSERPPLDETAVKELAQYIEEEIADIELMKSGDMENASDIRKQEKHKDPNAIPSWMLNNDPSGRQHYKKPR